MRIQDRPEWQALTAHAVEINTTHLRDLLQDEARNATLTADFESISYDFSRQNATVKTLNLLTDLAVAADLDAKVTAMASGERVNTTEDRSVLHMALRAPKKPSLVVDGHDIMTEVHQVREAIASFATRVRDGEKGHVGITGKVLRHVISIGIGGSYLGPEYVYEALREEGAAKTAATGRSLRFLANVDPVDVARATAGLDPAETLVIVVSKTFTTAETMLNAKTLKQWLLKGLQGSNNDVEEDCTTHPTAEAIVAAHMVAVSAAVPKAQAFGIQTANIFGFWDWVGGRYSVCSAVGLLPLALQYGPAIVDSFLAGAHSMDTHFLTAPIASNLPKLMGLWGIWNTSFLHRGTRALLPYSQALLRFSAHIQQRS